MVTQNLILRLKATANAVPKKLRVITKEDTTYELPKESFYYKSNRLETVVNTLDLLIAKAKKQLSSLEPPRPRYFEPDDEEFKRRLRTAHDGVSEDRLEDPDVLRTIFHQVRNRMEQEFEAKEEEEQHKFLRYKNALKEYIKTRQQNRETVSKAYNKELERITAILESMSQEESDALYEKEKDMFLHLEKKKEAMRLLTLEERISLMEKETSKYMKEMRK